MKKVNFNINKVLEELEKNAMTSEITSDLEMQVKDEEVAIHYQFTPGDIYSYFITMNHNKKSHSNLSELSKVISDAYSVSPLLANKMWSNLWDENRLLKGLQKRYFILVIYQNLLSLLGVDNAIALLLMEKYRLELALDQDYCGTEDVLKAVGKHYIEKYKYQDLMDIYDKYLKVNNINDRPESNEKICSLICSILAPINKSYDRIAKTLSTEKNLYYPCAIFVK